jgi:nitrogen fixation protein FixH
MHRRFGPLLATLLLVGCGRSERLEPLATGSVGPTRVIVETRQGTLIRGDNLIRVEFRDAADRPVDVSGTAITLQAPAVGAMAAQSRDVSLARRGVGVYEGRVGLNRTGPWEGNVEWQDSGTAQHWRFSTARP